MGLITSYSSMMKSRYEIAGFFMFSEFLNEYKTSIKLLVHSINKIFVKFKYCNIIPSQNTALKGTIILIFTTSEP